MSDYVSLCQLTKAELRFVLVVLDDVRMAGWVDSPHKRKRLALIAKISAALTPEKAPLIPSKSLENSPVAPLPEPAKEGQ